MKFECEYGVCNVGHSFEVFRCDINHVTEGLSFQYFDGKHGQREVLVSKQRFLEMVKTFYPEALK